MQFLMASGLTTTVLLLSLGYAVAQWSIVYPNIGSISLGVSFLDARVGYTTVVNISVEGVVWHHLVGTHYRGTSDHENDGRYHSMYVKRLHGQAAHRGAAARLRTGVRFSCPLTSRPSPRHVFMIINTKDPLRTMHTCFPFS